MIPRLRAARLNSWATSADSGLPGFTAPKRRRKGVRGVKFPADAARRSTLVFRRAGPRPCWSSVGLKCGRRVPTEDATVEGFCDFVMHSTPDSDARKRGRCSSSSATIGRPAEPRRVIPLGSPRGPLHAATLCEQGRASPLLGQIGERMAYARVVDREARLPRAPLRLGAGQTGGRAGLSRGRASRRHRGAAPSATSSSS